MTPTRRHRITRITGLAAVTLLALLSGLLARASNADSPATVTAVFLDASPLVVGNMVKLDGVQVGTISSIILVRGRASVGMSVDRAVLPLHTDATARIEPVSLLGERFVALRQGTPAAPVLTDPMLIPETQTSSSVDLNDLLNTLDDPTSTALAALVTTLGDGVSGQGAKLAQALAALQPSLRQTDRLSTLLDQQNELLANLIVQAQRNATAFAAPLDSLVGGAQQALDAVAANREAMSDTLATLPGTLSSARRTLTQLAATTDHSTDVLSGLRPLTDNLVRAGGELHEFADSADPALRALPPVLDRTNHMLDQARPVVADLGPASRDLSRVSGSVHTLSQQLLTHPPGVASQLENLMTAAADWAMGTSGYDGLGHYFRAVLVATPSSLANTGLGMLPPITDPNLANPVRPDPNGPARPGSSPLPFMPALPSPDGPNNGDPDSGDRGGLTGLTGKQEGDLFDQWLGGGN
jgi:phospholipid/cholesterol/gamma-HCH transport system substrate-binding protein